MNLFEAVKQNVTTRQAAERYGIRIRRNGMAVCPFHNDKNPSMKLDRRFHCFGCQADGDAVDFVSRLFGLPSKEAAMKIAVISDSTLQNGVILKNGQTVAYAVLDCSVIGQVQTSSDFFHGHARLCVLQFAVQVSSPLFSARLQELSFLRECHREEYPAGIRYSFSSPMLPQKAGATLHPSVAVRIAFPTSSEDGSNRTAPCSSDFLPADISAPG